MTLTAVLLLATGALLSAPALTRRAQRRIRPADAAFLEASSLIAGLLLAEAAFLVCAAPLVVSVLGTRPYHRLGLAHLFPGGSAAGLLSLALAVGLPVYVWLMIRRTVRTRARIAGAARAAGSALQVDGMEVLIHPSTRAIAFAVPGRCPAVVISDRLYEDLLPHELRLVVRHEVAHIRYHSKSLLLISVLEPLARRLPLLAHSVDVLRLSIERWADEAAIEVEADRSVIRDLLIRVAVEPVPGGVAALSGVDEVRERTDALGRPVPASLLPTWVAAMGLTLLSATAVAALVLWIG